MIRIGRKLALFALLLAAIVGREAAAQSSPDVEATVSQSTIYTGERIEFNIEISGDFTNVTRPEIPEIPGFRLLSSTPSTSRSFNFINGRTSTSYTYTYYMVAEREGNFRIPAVPVTIDSKSYRTNTIDVRIVDRNTSANSPGASSRPEIFLRLEVDEQNPVPGQQLIADVVLYFRDNLEVNNYTPVPGWKAEGFWKEELANQGRARAESSILDGVRYRRASLLQFALFPTKSGELSISPYEIAVEVRSSSSRNDPFSSFFGGFGTNQRQVELRSDPVTLEVRELPSGGEHFSGAVGDFSFNRSASTREVMVGESIEIETTVSGTGNIPLLSKPEYPVPDGLEVYAPEENASISRNNRRISGTKIFTDVLVARSPGTYTIPETTLSYFHPSEDRYITRTLPAIPLTVRRNPDAVTPAPENGALSVQPVTGLANWSSPGSGSMIGTWWFWSGITLPLLLLAVGYWQKSYRERMSSDMNFARSVRAGEKAAARLEEAVTRAEEGAIKEAYHMLQKALTGFVGDRLGLPEAGLSNQQYLSALQEEEVNEELIQNMRLLLDKCATISYAPNTTSEYLKSHVELAKSTLEKLKKEL
ncbi:MAG: BatD family protein [Balneolaceae bacterium]|nr:BatD family protein [Balneolaceae bacterium]